MEDRKEGHAKRPSRSRAARRFCGAGVLTLFLLGLAPGIAIAHEGRKVGDLEYTVGWSSEPAYAGFGNEVLVEIHRGLQPLEGAELEAVVSFGGADSEVKTDPIPLEPAFDEPGVYLGYMIPTRPGTYTFQISGTVEGKRFDETFTSGPNTFSDIQNSTAVEFPEQDPTRGEIAQALEQVTSRLDDLGSEVERVNEESQGTDASMYLAIGAGLVALIALALAARRRPA